MMRQRVALVRRLSFTLLAVGLGVALHAPRAAAQEALLVDAVQRGDTPAVRSLLAGNADVNATQGDGATALHWAAYRNDAETVTALIRAGADVRPANDHGVTPLALAARNGNAGIVAQLLTAGVDPNDPRQAVNAGETPLMLAARSRAGRCRGGAGGRRRRPRRAGGLERPVGAHVGGSRGTCPGRRDAHRPRRRDPRPLQQRRDAPAVRHPQGQHRRRARPARGGGPM